MELSLGLFFGNQGQIGQPLSEEISLLKCSSRSKQKILGLKALIFYNGKWGGKFHNQLINVTTKL